MKVNDLYEDFSDGIKLITLLELLTKDKLVCMSVCVSVCMHVSVCVSVHVLWSCDHFTHTDGGPERLCT